MTGQQITQFEQIKTLAGVIFLAYTIMAGAYWADSARWYDKAERLVKGPDREKIECFAKRAETLFRLSTATMVVTIILVALPSYISSSLLASIYKWLLLAPLAGIVVMALRYTAGRYFVPLR
ncbi:MAG: hypothetical protein ACE5NM_04355 [Sedimentisphaerales bacterium]